MKQKSLTNPQNKFQTIKNEFILTNLVFLECLLYRPIEEYSSFML